MIWKSLFGSSEPEPTREELFEISKRDDIDPAAVRAAINAGADVNAVDNYGCSALTIYLGNYKNNPTTEIA